MRDRLGPWTKVVTLSVTTILTVSCLIGATQSSALFEEDFESGLERWEISDPEAIFLADAADPEHGKVLRLEPAGARLHALIRGSERWPSYRIEGEVLFPTDEQNYMGFIYNYAESDGRVDLGSIYIKGNGSYIRANPRRDWNPGRRLYEELKVDLVGADSIRIGEWQRFAAEVSGAVCHFYVGDMATPKMTFDLYEHDSGRAGFKPRVVGGPVLLDDIRVRRIGAFTYQGPPLPEGTRYEPERMVTTWEVMGPFDRTIPSAEAMSEGSAGAVTVDGVEHRWRRFTTDPRGAVITGRVTDFLGPRTVAYFRTTIDVPASQSTVLEFSTIDDLAIWLDGRFEGYGEGDTFAWHDFGVNQDHPASPRTSLPLAQGINHVLIRIRGGRYATGGFFAAVRVEPEAFGKDR